jgi:hypothetical protein
MTDRTNSVAREVHSLLLETHPTAHEVQPGMSYPEPTSERYSSRKKNTRRKTRGRSGVARRLLLLER